MFLFWSINPDGQYAIVSGAILMPPDVELTTPFSLNR